MPVSNEEFKEPADPAAAMQTAVVADVLEQFSRPGAATNLKTAKVHAPNAWHGMMDHIWTMKCGTATLHAEWVKHSSAEGIEITCKKCLRGLMR